MTDDCIWPEGQQIIFQVYANGNKIGNPTIYKSMDDLIKCSSGSPRRFTKFGNLPYDTIIMEFDYITSKDLYSNLKIEIRITLNTNQEFIGHYGHVIANIISINL